MLEPLLLWRFLHKIVSVQNMKWQAAHTKKPNGGSTWSINSKEKGCVCSLNIQGDAKPTKAWKGYPEAICGLIVLLCKRTTPSTQGSWLWSGQRQYCGVVPYRINDDQWEEQLLLPCSPPPCLSCTCLLAPAHHFGIKALFCTFKFFSLVPLPRSTFSDSPASIWACRDPGVIWPLWPLLSFFSGKGRAPCLCFSVIWGIRFISSVTIFYFPEHLFCPLKGHTF